MKAPICCVCDRPFEQRKGDLVAFSNYQPLPEGKAGHPRGMEWFCGEHLYEARGLRHLDSTTVIARLKGA